MDHKKNFSKSIAVRIVVEAAFQSTKNVLPKRSVAGAPEKACVNVHI